MAFAGNDNLSTLYSELNSIFDSCSKTQNNKIQLEDLFEKLSELYGDHVIQPFKEALIPTLGTSLTNQIVTKEELFTLIKNVICPDFKIDENPSTPLSRRRNSVLTPLRSSTPDITEQADSTPPEMFMPEENITPVATKHFLCQNQCNSLSSGIYLSLDSESDVACRNLNAPVINDSLEKKLSDEESKNQLLEEKLKNERTKYLKISKDFESLKEETQRLWDTDEHLSRTLDELKILEAKYKTLFKENEKQKEIIERLNVQNGDLIVENKRLQEELQETNQKKNKVDSMFSASLNEISTLKAAITEMQNEIIHFQQNEKSLYSRIEQLKNEKQELRFNLTECDKSVLNELAWVTESHLSEERTTFDTNINTSSQKMNSSASLMSELYQVMGTDPLIGAICNSSNCFCDKHIQTDLSPISSRPPSEHLLSTKSTQTPPNNKESDLRLLTKNIKGDLNKDSPQTSCCEVVVAKVDHENNLVSNINERIVNVQSENLNENILLNRTNNEVLEKFIRQSRTITELSQLIRSLELDISEIRLRVYSQTHQIRTSGTRFQRQSQQHSSRSYGRWILIGSTFIVISLVLQAIFSEYITEDRLIWMPNTWFKYAQPSTW